MWDGKNSLRWANALVFLVCWLTCLCLKSYRSTEGVLFWWFVFELTAEYPRCMNRRLFSELLKCTSAINTLVKTRMCCRLLRPFLTYKHSVINWYDVESAIWIRNRKTVGKRRIKPRHGRNGFLDFAPKLPILPPSKNVTARTRKPSRWSFYPLAFLFNKERKILL